MTSKGYYKLIQTPQGQTKVLIPWPAPTDNKPEQEELQDMVFDGECLTTDGCPIEPDGVCQHNHPSWLIKLGLI